jgi:hypothetical protein
MKETPLYGYYAFGYNYHILRAHSTGKKAEALRGSVAQFLQNLEELNLPVTRQAAVALDALLEEIKKMPNDAVIDEAFATRVTNACNTLDGALDAELTLRTAFVVTPKRFDLRHLLEEPWLLLGADAPTQMPVLARFDFAQACRCIAFDLPTAAAFHVMRCLEGTLRACYCASVKQKNKRVTPLLWGPMIDHLRTRQKKPPKALLDHLDNIRANFRNPTQHPEARYNLEEAQDLLAITIDALNRMCRQLAGHAT